MTSICFSGSNILTCAKQARHIGVGQSGSAFAFSCPAQWEATEPHTQWGFVVSVWLKDTSAGTPRRTLCQLQVKCRLDSTIKLAAYE